MLSLLCYLSYVITTMFLFASRVYSLVRDTTVLGSVLPELGACCRARAA